MKYLLIQKYQKKKEIRNGTRAGSISVYCAHEALADAALAIGKDVAPEEVARQVKARGVRLVGLSALMTTTVPFMEQTVKAVRAAAPGCKIMVGGAVLTQKYADMIGADSYSKDAMGAVRYAEEVFSGS